MGGVDQRKRFIYPAVYKTDTTQGLMKYQSPSLLGRLGSGCCCCCCCLIHHTAACFVFFFSKSFGEASGCQGEVKKGGEHIQSLSASLSLSVCVSLSLLLCLSSCTNCENSFRQQRDEKVCIAGTAFMKAFALSMNVCLPVFHSDESLIFILLAASHRGFF